MKLFSISNKFSRATRVIVLLLLVAISFVIMRYLSRIDALCVQPVSKEIALQTIFENFIESENWSISHGDWGLNHKQLEEIHRSGHLCSVEPGNGFSRAWIGGCDLYKKQKPLANFLYHVGRCGNITARFSGG
jgi:hypothetical protein